MDKVVQWYTNNSNEITWFVIGVCVTGGINSLALGNYVSAMVNFAIAYLNYMLNRR